MKKVRKQFKLNKAKTKTLTLESCPGLGLFIGTVNSNSYKTLVILLPFLMIELEIRRKKKEVPLTA
jgi:hypothetical protein